MGIVRQAVVKVLLKELAHVRPGVSNTGKSVLALPGVRAANAPPTTPQAAVYSAPSPTIIFYEEPVIYRVRLRW